MHRTPPRLVASRASSSSSRTCSADLRQRDRSPSLQLSLYPPPEVQAPLELSSPSGRPHLVPPSLLDRRRRARPVIRRRQLQSLGSIPSNQCHLLVRSRTLKSSRPSFGTPRPPTRRGLWRRERSNLSTYAASLISLLCSTPSDMETFPTVVFAPTSTTYVLCL